MGKVRARLIISGVVQGVFFRSTTVEVASTLLVGGWVRNNPNGTVEAIIEGDEAQVRKVIEWCREGPSMARVDNVEVAWEEYTGEFDRFRAATSSDPYW